MRVIKRALCILVILALAASIVPTSASASSLAVVGTTLSSAGMTSAEFAAAAGPYALGILAALAAAYGIKTFVQSDTGQAVKEYFQGLIEKRAQATRRSVAEQMEALLGNATINEDGSINLGRLSFAEARETLMQDDIPVTKPSIIKGINLLGYTFGNAKNYVFRTDNTGYRYTFYFKSENNVINNMFFVNENGYPSILYKRSDAPISGGITFYVKDITSGTKYSLGTIYDFNRYTLTIGGESYCISIIERDGYYCEYAPVNNIQDIINRSYALDDLRIDYSEDTLYGVDETLRDQNVGLNDGLVLAPDLINSAVLGGASGQITASDYCGALVDYVSGYDTVIDGVTVTGLPEAGTVPRTIDEAPATDTVVDEAPPSTMTGTEAAGLYSFSLDELFPFCLPFDFVKIIEKFDVEPEAPNFDWRFYIPGVIDYTLHIDLSAWNNAAQVCRTMVLIAFMVGLIMLTRQIFIRA